VDSNIQPLNNWGQGDKMRMERVKVKEKETVTDSTVPSPSYSLIGV